MTTQMRIEETNWHVKAELRENQSKPLFSQSLTQKGFLKLAAAGVSLSTTLSLTKTVTFFNDVYYLTSMAGLGKYTCGVLYEISIFIIFKH